ncbi:hypothetical protein [Elizabethkingia anophelis]|nr:hypothetical protein [Elizabethkingia anophelis]KMU60600.1 putative TonB-dependent receptor [Elizabethkingia anophelis]MCS7372923.1 hypothetical protein [Elizabethkingia anophelis]DAC75548.1 TPA_exp: putative TonB-dependent receptor [Elizabethkingia anophelis]DAC76334.1 TPA_exp: putative TonB-dependent receptor [Elizabethkingia anophelis]
MKIINTKYIYFTLLFFSYNLYFSQTITGNIKDSISKENVFANVVIKDTKKSNDISEFTVTKNGNYKIQVSKFYKRIVLEVNALGYSSITHIIEAPEKDKIYNLNFFLKKEQIKNIKEIILTSNKKKFSIKEDTIKYNVSAYRDGSERKIEEIIKKLPGIQVNEKSGEIKYKGKSIETVQLEGDDLFGSNYSLGTKNINVDMVEQVQAIENYSANPLLKGIENGDKVALNLKLKKGRLDLSGNTEYGSGFSSDNKQIYNIGANILGVSKNYKSFGTFSYNNVGINNSPFDYFGFNYNTEQIKERDFFAKKLIPESIFTSSLDDSRANINNAIFGNYNSIFKIGKKASLKLNLYYTQDKILQTQFFQNNILTGDGTFSTSDLYQTQKKPFLYRGDIELKINTSKNSLLEYKARISQENINTQSSVLQNNKSSFNTKLYSESFLFRQDLIYTKKISDKKALQMQLFQSYNNAPQNLSISPSLNLDSLTIFKTQYSRYTKQIFSIQSTLLGSTLKTKYAFSIGATLEKDPFTSFLNDNMEINNNNFSYIKNSIWFKGAYHFQYGNLKISPSYTLSYFNQNLNNISAKRNDFLIEPSLALKYRLGENSSLFTSINYAQKSFSEEYFLINPLFTSPRNNISSTPSLDIKKTISYNLYYLTNNLFKQFQFRLGFLYNKDNGNYFSNFNVTENVTRLNYFYLPKSNESFTFNFMVEKYLPIIQSTVRLTSDLSISNYKNIVNNSDLRNNKFHNLTSEFFFKTAFDSKINFENQFKFFQNISKSEDSEKFENNSLQNTFKVIIKPHKKWFILFSSEYYIPNLDKKDNYLFLDATFRFIPNKIFDFNFYAKNILNKKVFSQVETTDFSTTIFQSNLIQRYYMLSVSYNF